MPPKNSIGIGTKTYMNAVSIGHQLCHSRQPSSCSSTPRLKLNAKAPARRGDTIHYEFTSRLCNVCGKAYCSRHKSNLTQHTDILYCHGVAVSTPADVYRFHNKCA